MYGIRKKSGLALVSAIMLSSIIMIVMSIVLFRIVYTTQDTVLIKKQNAAKNIADEGLEHMVDWMNARNSPLNYPNDPDPQSLLEFKMDSEKFLKPLNDTSSIIDLSNKLLEGETTYKRFQNGESLFSPILTTNLYNVTPNGMTTNKITELSLDSLNSQINIYRIKAIDNKTSKIKGEIQVGAKRLNSPSSSYDVLQIVAYAHIPSIDDPNKLLRKFTAIVQRPKDVTVKLENAILSESTVNMGNAEADGATSMDQISLVTKDGDVHSNVDIILGPNAKIDGDATAYGNVMNKDGTAVSTGDPRITGAVTQNAPYKPVPDVNYDKTFPPNECVDTDARDDYRNYTGPCTISGDLIMTGGKDHVTITDKVYVKGQYKENGSNDVVIESGSPNAMLIVQNSITTAGSSQASYSGENKMVFVSVQGDIDIKGNANVYGLFIGDSPTSTVTVTGSSTLFGGIVSKGDVQLNGKTIKVVRDTSMKVSPFKTPVERYSMRLVSWKEIK